MIGEAVVDVLVRETEGNAIVAQRRESGVAAGDGRVGLEIQDIPIGQRHAVAGLHLNDLTRERRLEVRCLYPRGIELDRTVLLEAQLRRALRFPVAVRIPVPDRPGVVHDGRSRVVELRNELELARRTASVDAIALDIEPPEIRVVQGVVVPKRIEWLAGDIEVQIALGFRLTPLPDHRYLVVSRHEEELRCRGRVGQQELGVEHRLRDQCFIQERTRYGDDFVLLDDRVIVHVFLRHPPSHAIDRPNLRRVLEDRVARERDAGREVGVRTGGEPRHFYRRGVDVCDHDRRGGTGREVERTRCLVEARIRLCLHERTEVPGTCHRGICKRCALDVPRSQVAGQPPVEEVVTDRVGECAAVGRIGEHRQPDLDAGG